MNTPVISDDVNDVIGISSSVDSIKQAADKVVLIYRRYC